MTPTKILTALLVVCLGSTALGDAPKIDADGETLPAGVLARLGSSRFTHSANVDHIAFAADGKSVVFVGRDSVVGRWNIPDGKETGRVQLQPNGPRSFLLSPDGTTIAQARSNQGAVVIDAATGKERYTAPRRGAGTPVLGWGKNGQTLLGAAGNEVQIWDATARGELAQWKLKPGTVVAGIAGSADGTRVAVLHETANVTLHDAATGRELKSISRPGAARPSRVMAHALAFSPDGKNLLDCASSRSVYVWDVASAKHVTWFGRQNDHPFTAAWSPDGKYLATLGNDSTVRLLDAETGKLVKTLTTVSYARVLRFSPDGRFLAATGNSPCPEFWSVATG